MTKILGSNDVTFISRPKQERHRRRVLEPVLFAQVNKDAWELYVCVYRDGEFRRIALPLEQARRFLAEQLDRITAAIKVAEVGVKDRVTQVKANPEEEAR
jgi:hypothetical protein